jgi:chaperonin GroES
MNVQPLSNKVFIEPENEEKTTKSGIVLPENTSGERPMIGKVIAIGPGKTNANTGAIIPMTVKIGDKILFKKYGPDEIEIEDKKYLVGDEDDILAIIK